MHIKTLIFGLIVTVSGCSPAPYAPRVVPAKDDARGIAGEPGVPLTKDPRRIATH